MIFNLATAVRTALAGLLAFFISYYFNLPHAYWLIIATLLIVPIHSGENVWQHALFILSTGLVSALLVFLIECLIPYHGVALILVVMVTFAVLMLTLSYPHLFLELFVINVFAVLALDAAGDWMMACVDAYLILVGASLALMMNAVVWPKRNKRDVRLSLAKCLMNLAELLVREFATYVDKQFPAKHLQYEQQIHHLSSGLLENINRIRKLVAQAHPLQQELYQKIITGLERSFELVLALGSLRYQVTDHTTFSVVEAEFLDVSSELHKAIDYLADIAIQRKVPAPPDQVQNSIDAIEDVNQSALQVVAGEPIVFLLFIEKLRCLYDELNQMKIDLLKLNTATEAHV